MPPYPANVTQKLTDRLACRLLALQLNDEPSSPRPAAGLSAISAHRGAIYLVAEESVRIDSDFCFCPMMCSWASFTHNWPFEFNGERHESRAPPHREDAVAP